LNEFKSAKWIIKGSIHDTNIYRSLISRVDQGEAEAITLAKELNADYLLIDEKKGRKIAHEFGLRTVGLLGVLLKAKTQKHISVLKPVLDRLMSGADFWISEDLYSHSLKLAGE
jgi:predicted nucleic acid-binding protein